MTRYSDSQKPSERARLSAALKQLAAIQEECRDVLVIPDVITIEDVCRIALDTTRGPQLVGDVCSREEIVHILHAFEANPCADSPLVAQIALEDYRQTQAFTQE